MTKLAILEYPDPRLRTKAAAVEVVDERTRRLVDDMLDTMYAANGVGLAATQVDVHERVIVIDVSDERNEPVVLINPEIIELGGEGPGEEGCLSVPGIYDKVQRAIHVRVRALGRDGVPYERAADGLLAVCIQHEIDHLSGKLFVDYLSELKRTLIRKRLAKERKERRGRDASAATPGHTVPGSSAPAL